MAEPLNNAFPAVDQLPAGTLLGDYEVRRKIGEGGFAVVYEAEHRALKKRVAIKLLLPHTGTSVDVVQRFLREGEAAARLEHPNVVAVTHVGMVNSNTPFMVMDYLEGEDLGALLKRERKLSAQQLVDILLPVLSAVSAAHEAGIVHRDLKPDNIFLCRTRRGRVVPKVLDFGISKVSTKGGATTLNLTASDAILGTPYYMSPEQARGARTVDQRSDVFALGVIMFEAATGQRPFTGDSLYSVLTRIVAEEPPRPSEVSIPFEPELEKVILRALRKDPAERFQSVRDMGAALLSLAGEHARINFEHDFGGERPSVVSEIPRGRAGAAELRSAPSRTASARLRGRRFRLAGVGALFVLLFGGGVLWGLSESPPLGAAASGAVATPAPRESLPPREVQKPQPEVDAVEPVPAAEPEVPSEAPSVPSPAQRVTLVAEPPQATLTVDGTTVGKGSVTLELPDDGQEHALVVEARGYRTKRLRFTHDSPPQRVVLQRRPVTRRPGSRAEKPVHERASAGEKRVAKPEPAERVQEEKPAPAPQPARGANNALILR